MWGTVWVRRRTIGALNYVLLPEQAPYQPGMRLLVPLGRYNTPYIALLIDVYESAPPPHLKTILQKLDEKPLYDEASLALFRWMAEYYMAAPGDLAHLLLPGRVGGISDWRIIWQSSPEQELSPRKHYRVLRTLGETTLRAAAHTVGFPPKKLLSLLRRWEKTGALRLEAVIRGGVRAAPSFVEVSPAYREASAFEKVWATFPPEAQVLLLELLQRTLCEEPPLYAHIARRAPKIIKSLLRAGILQRTPARRYYEKLYARPLQRYALTPSQTSALAAIRHALAEKPTRPILLHGITASGKTFVYMELMREVLQQGKQVLYLLPEIALTKQTLDRLRATFGEAMELYHSALSEAERFRLWKAVRSDAVDVVVGTRSALFLPFHRLGLIIVDEEHDPSFGQEGRPPFYQARDTAVYYAHLRKIPIILGSATPALETYHNAKQGKYAYVPLREKAIPTASPELYLVDMRVELSEKLNTGVFSSVLRETMEEALNHGEQIILFRNRRGYAPMLLCQTCGHRWECPDCAITLTYHKHKSMLLCHYCGHREKAPARCPVCGSDRLSFSGIGTERIEEQIKTFFPHARVLRMDRDTTGGHRHEAIISAFERGEADILVGTQMVTKGLDFERVTVIGVLYADSLLGRIDFRAEERAYQLLVQLIGRAGRRGSSSRVIVQTFKPDTPLFHLLKVPYETFADQALRQREKYGYPPFRRLIEVSLFHADTHLIEAQAEAWGQALNQQKWGEVLGPVYAEIPRVRGRYHMLLRLKLPSPYSYRAVRQGLLRLREYHFQRWGSQAAWVLFRVDP